VIASGPNGRTRPNRRQPSPYNVILAKPETCPEAKGPVCTRGWGQVMKEADRLIFIRTPGGGGSPNPGQEISKPGASADRRRPHSREIRRSTPKVPIRHQKRRWTNADDFNVEAGRMMKASDKLKVVMTGSTPTSGS